MGDGDQVNCNATEGLRRVGALAKPCSLRSPTTLDQCRELAAGSGVFPSSVTCSGAEIMGDEESAWLLSLADGKFAERGGVDPSHASTCVARLVDTLTSKSKSFYVRALAVRALGMGIRANPQLTLVLDQMERGKERTIEALMEIISIFRNIDVQTTDSRKINVNCSMLLSMLMQGTTRGRVHCIVSRVSHGRSRGVLEEGIEHEIRDPAYECRPRLQGNVRAFDHVADRHDGAI